MRALRAMGCQILTGGQCLQPTLKHRSVAEFGPPARFAGFGTAARGMAAVHVASGPRVRRSHRADESDGGCLRTARFPS
jgi:lipoic acid synthetase